LLILSFTPATSTLVLRGILVLVRRILNNGTLEVKQIIQEFIQQLMHSFYTDNLWFLPAIINMMPLISPSVQRQYLLRGIIFPAKNLSMPPKANESKLIKWILIS